MLYHYKDQCIKFPPVNAWALISNHILNRQNIHKKSLKTSFRLSSLFTLTQFFREITPPLRPRTAGSITGSRRSFPSCFRTDVITSLHLRRAKWTYRRRARTSCNGDAARFTDPSQMSLVGLTQVGDPTYDPALFWRVRRGSDGGDGGVRGMPTGYVGDGGGG